MKLFFPPATASNAARIVGFTLLVVRLASAQQASYTYDMPGNLTGVTQAVSSLPVITAGPTSHVVSQDGNVYFSVAASGPGPLTYQWLSNGIPIAGGVTDTLTITNVAVPKNALTNGSFESPPVVVAYVTRATLVTFGGWVVESGNVDHVYTSWWAADGVQSLDLNGTATGAVYTDVPTSPGQLYFLRYALAGNYAVPSVKTNTVWWDGSVLATNTFNSAGKSFTAMGWTNYEHAVSATTSTTRIRFVSLASGGGGPALDEVSLVPAPAAPVNYSVIVSNSSGSVTSVVANIAFDTDQNGLADSWERAYFGATGRLPEQDSDGDTVSNLDEYLEGTNPADPASLRPRLNISVRPGGLVARSPFRPSYLLNESVQITAMPDPGNFFLGWAVGITNANATVNLTMDATKNISALFAVGMTSGASSLGSVASADTNTYGFPANAGDRLVLRVGELADGGGFDPEVQLFSPSGVLLGTASGFAAAELAVTVTNTGLFLVVVSDGPVNGALGTGDFSLQLAKLPGSFVVPSGDEGGDLANGANSFGSISVGDMDLWSLNASAGQNIVIRVGQLSEDNPDFDPWIRLYNPNGVLLGSQSGYVGHEIAVVATNSGTFTVLVADAGLASPYYVSDTGTYRLHLARSGAAFDVPIGDEGGDMVNGGNHPAEIEVGDLDLWSFPANSGDNIILRIAEVTDPSGDFDPWIRLYDPIGALLGSAHSFTAGEIAVRATNAGTFFVVVADAGDASPYYLSDPGTYQLRLAKSPAAFVVQPGDEGGELANGANNPAAISAGDLDMWSFAANTGDSIVLRVAELTDANGDFDPYIRLYGPNGVLLDSDYNYTAGEVTLRVTNSGIFTVVVSDIGFASPYYLSDAGTYQIRLAKAPGAFVVADEGATLAPAGVYYGTNDVGDLDVWGFWANQGNTISAQLEQLTDDNGRFDPWIRLYGPTGILLNSVWGVASAVVSRVATNTGPYLVVVSDGALVSPYYLSDPGTYRLTLGGITGPPRLTSLSLNGSQWTLTGSGGPANSQFTVLSQTNVTAPLPLWTPLQTNTFNALGQFSITNNIVPGPDSLFFRLRVGGP